MRCAKEAMQQYSSRRDTTKENNRTRQRQQRWRIEGRDKADVDGTNGGEDEEEGGRSAYEQMGSKSDMPKEVWDGPGLGHGHTGKSEVWSAIGSLKWIGWDGMMSDYSYGSGGRPREGGIHRVHEVRREAGQTDRRPGGASRLVWSAI